MEQNLKSIINRLTADNKRLLMEIEELKHLIFELKLVLYRGTDDDDDDDI